MLHVIVLQILLLPKLVLNINTEHTISLIIVRIIRDCNNKVKFSKRVLDALFNMFNLLLIYLQHGLILDNVIRFLCRQLNLLISIELVINNRKSLKRLNQYLNSLFIL